MTNSHSKETSRPGSSKAQTVAELRRAFLDYFVSKQHTLVESSSLLPQGDPTLLFVNSGMVQFKDCFRGTDTRPYSRATTCQKCLRVSGKHNDYEQIGQTPRHHTFFEMLGNFSLGDYFKDDAIKFAWEFVTEVIGLPKEFLWVTVHNSDDEAAGLWAKVTDISPDRIVKLGDDTNLWAMGDFGPRGYCSEIFYYMGDNPATQSREEFLKDDGSYLEIWNLVFMQFNRNLDGTVVPLPKPCIDTGSGLERVAAIVQGVKSNFDTDLFRSLLASVEKASGLKYDGSSYDKNKIGAKRWQTDVAMRVIVDHARAIAFLLADGIAPSNEKEGYVLRRLIRRATMRGEFLGIHDAFLADICAEVISLMGESYPELVKHKEKIRTLTSQEEAQFRKTLSSGLKLLAEAVEKLKPGAVLSGEVAFKLHDTFGFPLDLTEDALKDRGIGVDRSGFETLMEAQRDRSRPSAMREGSSAAALKDMNFEGDQTVFLGYKTLSAESSVQAIAPAPAVKEDSGRKRFYIVLKESPFYPEMGGQVGDRGTLKIGGLTFEVTDTQKTHSAHTVHICALQEGDAAAADEGLIGKTAVAAVDEELRRRTAQNHSGTHLLGAALRKVLGEHIEQRGSLVAPDRLRFDFVHSSAISQEDISQIQTLFNKYIAENHAVETLELPITEARKRGAIAVFGEKYGEHVRVIEMGPVSTELCGGTHVKRTGDIGMAVILSEGSIAQGIRRIEALTGLGAAGVVSRLQETIKSVSQLVGGSAADLPTLVSGLKAQSSALSKELKDKNELIASFISRELAAGAQTLGSGAKSVICDTDQELDREMLMLVAEKTLAQLKSGAVVLGQKRTGNLVAYFSSEISSKTGAGALVKEISAKVGGKGGGKPQSATLVQVPPEKFDEVFQIARRHLGME